MQSVDANGMVFVPARVHPFKSQVQLANHEERATMVALAIADNVRFLLEAPPDRSGFTIDLVDCLRAKYPSARFFLVIGSDLIDEFAAWHKHEELEQSVPIVIAARPGYRLKNRADEVLRSAERVMIPQYDISSSDIRKRVQSQRSIRYMVPESVAAYIAEKRLYVR